MAIFTIKYLRSIGFSQVNNDMFELHSWYFRNALVRANYRNVQIGVNPDSRFLVAFFRNLLLGENTPLQNRSLHIARKGGEPQSANNAIQSANSPSPKCKSCTLEETAVLRLIQQNPAITQKQIAEQISKSIRTVKTITARLAEQGILIRINGKRNGQWLVCND